MGAFAGEFTLTRLERVISGPGRVAALPGELDRLGCARAVIVTGRTLAASSLIDKVIGPAGDRVAAVFAQSRQHVPAGSICNLLRVIMDTNADCLISFGGGSPIDTAKVAHHALLTDADSRASVLGESLIHFAIPTTLSAGEFTAVAGVTDESTRIKRAVRDPRLAPRVVFTDPELTLETPDRLWAASGIRALDHAIESIYSPRHHPMSDTLAAKAIMLLTGHLLRSLTSHGDERLDHRGQCQIAAWLSVVGMASSGFGLSHVLGHQIGPRWNVPHGVTSCIVLPHAMRFMAALAADRFGPIAEAYGIAFDASQPRAAALECADRTAAFVSELSLPTRLRDVQVPPGDLDEVARVVHGIIERTRPLDREITQGELLALLQEAY